MKKTILSLAMGIILLASLGLASAIYAGESYSFQSEEFEYYTVIGNSSNLNGMNVTWENGNTTISFVLNFAPDNFTIVLFNQEEKIITKYVHSGGGGSIRYVENKTIVEVPKYIIEYVDRNITIEKESPSTIQIIKEIPFYVYFAIAFFGLIIYGLIYSLRKQILKSKELEENNENNKRNNK